MSSIEIKGLTKRYGDLLAVDSLSLNIASGEFFALLGVNGAGKTTTIKMLSCLTSPDGGDAHLGGHSIRTEAEAVKKITDISPQETSVAPNLTVRENLEFVSRIYGLGKKGAAEHALIMMKKYGLTDVASQRAKTLSGGWQRRLSIAMALASEPEILFLDEPTLGLDVLARRELWDAISALKGEVTVILTTHYLEEAEHLADRIGIMANGKLCAVGTAQELTSLADASSFEDAFVALAAGKDGQNE